MRRTLGNAVFSGMLGVTVFGIFLTPVFFFTIGWLGKSRLFSWRPVRLAGDLTLYILALGFVRRPIKRLTSRLAAARKESAAKAKKLEEIRSAAAAAVTGNGSALAEQPAVGSSTNGTGKHLDSVAELK